MLAITIGNFDGVHRGHAALVAAARRAAGEGGRVVAVTFEPHPMTRLRPDEVVPRLTSARERRALLLEVGADDVLEIDPTPEFLAFSPERFVRRLHEQIPFGHVVEGPDFRFGHRRAGSVETLRALGATLDFAVEVLEPLDCALGDGTVVRASSSLVRWLVIQGRVRDAALVLGRPYALAAPTVRGDRRGRTIGVPTMNLDHGAALLPADGVYGGIATLPDGRTAVAAISVGTKPSFGTSERTCEAHLCDLELPLDWYDFELRLDFRTWIREQLTFDAVEALVARMARDIAETRTRLADQVAPSVGAVGASR